MIYHSINKSKKTQLQKTKIRLSAIFAGVVFLISLLLVSVFLTYKYQISGKKDKNDFVLISNDIAKNIDNNIKFLQNFKEKKENFQNKGKLNERKRPHNFNALLFTNFIVADTKENNVLFWNINKNFDVQSLVGTKLKTGFFIQDGIMVYTIPLKNSLQEKTLISFQEIRYGTAEYFHDLLRFFVISLISSAIFYYVGFIFVSKNLKPVEENLEDMQNFIHNAGHELKTPLSIIHGNLQILGTLKKHDVNLAKESIGEINKLNHLIESLIELSDIQEYHKTQKFVISDEIETIIRDFSKKAEAKKIKIIFDKKSPLVLDVNRQYFYIFFSNILGNAIKYNKKGGTIHISLEKKSLTVTDTGIGIEKDKLTKVYDRFYKADNVRNNEGYGIGLSLVKKIADSYRWKLKITSKIKSGTTVKVFF